MSGWEIKAHTLQYGDPHARFHDKDWLTVECEADLRAEFPVLLCTCACGNPVRVFEDTVYRRREKRRA